MLSAVGERSEVDGVPVFWHQDPDTELYAELIIGCGERDETFRTRGVGRLIVALALSALPPLRLKLGSAVDRETLRFYAVGPPDLVTEFLEHLCRALADLPLYRLTREAGAVYAEWRTERLTTTAALLTQRYGLVGYGLEGWFGPGVDRIGPELVHEHAVRHLVRDNAVLVVGGAHRPGLRLPLPAGPRPPRSVQQPLPVAAGPKLLVADVNVGIGLRGGPVHDPTWELATTLLGRRIDRGARNERGLNVAIGMEVVAPGPDHAERILWCNAGDEHDSELASILWEAVTELAGNGPTAGELHSAFGVEMAVLDEPTAPMLETQRAAHAELFGLEFLPDREWLGTAADVTARDVGAAVDHGARVGAGGRAGWHLGGRALARRAAPAAAALRRGRAAARRHGLPSRDRRAGPVHGRRAGSRWCSPPTVSPCATVTATSSRSRSPTSSGWRRTAASGRCTAGPASRCTSIRTCTREALTWSGRSTGG